MAEAVTYTKDDLDAAIAAAVGRVQESVDKLEAKNEQLIGENRKLKRSGEIKPEDLTAAEERADKAEAALAEATKLAKAAGADREKIVKALEAETAFTQKLLIQDGLKTALISNGVKDEDFIDSLTAKFAGMASIVTEGDARKAMLGDKPLDAAIKEWAAGDAGKKFVSAPNNSGGGAPGAPTAAGTGARTMTRSAFDALDQMAKGTAGASMAKGELRVVDDAA